jgi:pyruvate dehydrogenase E1 component alpha subunit
MAGSYSIPGVSVDGQDVVEVYEAAAEAVKRAREGGGPTLLEARTYRFYGHSLGDEQQYRSVEEVDEWKENRDPIKLLAQFMRDRDWLSEEQDQSIQAEAKAEMSAATQFAEESPWPSAEDVTTDVLAPVQEVA